MPSSMPQLRCLMPNMTQLRQLAVCPPQAGGEVRDLTTFIGTYAANINMYMCKYTIVIAHATTVAGGIPPSCHPTIHPTRGITEGYAAGAVGAVGVTPFIPRVGQSGFGRASDKLVLLSL